jgi:hypothetical protein
MKPAFLILAIAALAVPASALGKGPSAASMDGPGSGGGITFSGDGESGGSPLGDLTEQSGFFPAVFTRQPDPMLDSRPNGELGPKYTVTYTVPGPNNETWKIKQDVYPYAEHGPVTYMKPGQEIFELGGTRGGWFQATPQLKETLVSAGLPRSAPSATTDRWTIPRVTMSALAILLFVFGAVIMLRRRLRPAARMAGSPT